MKKRFHYFYFYTGGDTLKIKSDVLYNKQKETVKVIKQDNDALCCIVKKILNIQYNNGKDSRKQKINENRIYSIYDIGIKLFFCKEDVDNDPLLIANDDRYNFNYKKITKHIHTEHNNNIKSIQEDEPIRKLSPAEKEKIISSYYSEEFTKQEEMDFYNSTNIKYFGRFDLDTEFYRRNFEQEYKNHYYDRIYISKTSHYKKIGDVHIVNWRSPIANIYYDNEKTEFTSDIYVDIVNKYRTIIDTAGNKSKVPMGNTNNVYNYQLMLKRSLSFNPFKYNNLYISGENELYDDGSVDPFLLELIAENRLKNRITDIIRSIQANQNEIIRLNPYQNMIVQGCAGSGKTMILLHRVSYLKYNQFIADYTKIKIIGPNKLFSNYFNDLSHQLEIDQIKQLVINEYYISLIEKYHQENKECIKDKLSSDYKLTLNFIKKLKRDYESDNLKMDHSLNHYYTDSVLEKVKQIYDENIKDIYYSDTVQDVIKILPKFNLDDKINVSSYNNSLLNKILEVCKMDLKQANNLKNKEYEDYKSKKLVNFNYYYNNIKNSYSIQQKNYIEEFNKLDKIITISLELLKSYEDIHFYKSTMRTIKQITEEITNKEKLIEEKFKTETKTILNDIETLTNKLNHLNPWNIKSKENIQHQINNKRDLYNKIKNNKNEFTNSQINQDIKQLKTNLENEIHKIAPKKEFRSDEQIIEYLDNLIINTNKSITIGKDKLLKNTNINEISYEKLITYLMNVSHRYFKYVTSLINQLKINFKRLDKTTYKNKIESTLNRIEVMTDSFVNELKIIDLNKTYDEFETISHFTDTLEKYIEVIKRVNNLFPIIMPVADNLYKSKNKKLKEMELKLNELKSYLLTDDEKSKIEKCKDKLNNKSYCVFKIFKKVKDKLRDNKNQLYLQDIFILLYLHYLHFGPVKNHDQYLFIDEAQDYSYQEFNLIHLVNNKKTCFNIFGDINQLINKSRGVKDWNILNQIIENKYYELNENYRNTIQITELCNEKFGYNHIPIGLQGPNVKTIEFNQIYSIITNEIKVNPKVRIAIISNIIDKDLKKNIENIKTNENPIFYNNIQNVKGLEFEIVFVLNDIKDKNQLYISYTRSLKHLYIIQ